MTDARSVAEQRRVARRLLQTSRETRALARGSGAALRGLEIEDGPLTAYGADGLPVLQVGVETEDGNFTSVENGVAPPPTPTAPSILEGPGSITIIHDGTFVDSALQDDFSHFEIHASHTPGYVADDTTQIGSFFSDAGGEWVFATSIDDGTWYFSIQAVNKSLIEGPKSAEVAGTALVIFDDTQLQADLAQLETDLAANTASLNTLNTVTIPGLNADIAANTNAIDTLNTITIPGLDADISANTSSINTLNTVTIPGLQSDLDAAEVALSTAQGEINTLEGKFPITAPDIAANAVEANKILALAVVAGKIATDAVTANTIVANAITAAKIAANTITATQIAANTLTANEIAADAITASEIAANAVTTTELNALAVVAGKIAANTITAAQIAATTITAAQIAGDTITANQIATDAITANEIAANAVTANEINALAVVAGKIATDAVTANTIAANAVVAGKIAANAVTAGTIAANAITANEITALAITSKHTITGAVIQTAASGSRVVITGSSSPQDILFYTGHRNEDVHGTLGTSFSDPGGTFAGSEVQMIVNGPRLNPGFNYTLGGALRTRIIMKDKNVDFGIGISTVELQADEIQFDVKDGGLIVDSNASVAASLKTLNTNGTRINFGFNLVAIQNYGAGGGTRTAGNTAGLHAADIHSWTGGVFMEDLAGGGVSGANINNAGRVIRSSTERIKENITPMTRDEAYTVVGLESYTGEFKESDGLKDPRRYPFFIAEQGAKAGAELWVGRQHDVIYNDEGEVVEIRRNKKGKITSFRTEAIPVAHNLIIKDLLEDIRILKEEVAALKAA